MLANLSITIAQYQPETAKGGATIRLQHQRYVDEEAQKLATLQIYSNLYGGIRTWICFCEIVYSKGVFKI